MFLLRQIISAKDLTEWAYRIQVKRKLSIQGSKLVLNVAV